MRKTFITFLFNVIKRKFNFFFFYSFSFNGQKKPDKILEKKLKRKKGK